MENKQHFFQIDFIRVVCCIGIIIYHYVCHSNANIGFLVYLKNSDLGVELVTIFFIVSGFVICHNNFEVKSLKEYYYKRFKSIFPSFYFCWFIFYIYNVIKTRSIFYLGNPLNLFFTLIGEDGYLSQRITTYYTVGEWFLGALIIIYALYPFLLKALKKNDLLTLIALIILTTLVNLLNIPVLSYGFPGICETSLKFYFGMILYKHINILYDKKVLIASLLFFIIYTIIKINMLNTILDIIYAISLFIILFNIGKHMNNKYINKISGISYQIFLFQHQVIIHVLEITNPSNTFSAIMLLIICILITIIFAQLLKTLVNALYKTKAYIKFENALMRR